MASLNFPGQTHRWRLSQFLQKGYLRTRETLLRDLALAAHFIFITAKARISGPFFSVIESARALLRGILMLVDMAVGIPSLLAHDLDEHLGNVFQLNLKLKNVTPSSIMGASFTPNWRHKWMKFGFNPTVYHTQIESICDGEN